MKLPMTLPMALRSVIISGGGTGGHIYPALAIADEIKRRHPDCTIRFVGAEGRMEMEKIPQAGYPIDGLWITGIERKLLSKKNLSFPFRIVSSLLKARRILKEHRPNAVAGVGGFASGPLLFIASRMGIPTLIQEQNSFPGVTNKLLAKRAKSICTGFPGMERWFPAERTVHTGNPLRAVLGSQETSREAALHHFELNNAQPTVFIMGGSLGAKSMNDGVAKALATWSEKGYNVLWQTGKRFAAENEQLVRAQGWNTVKVLGFIDRMDYAYAAADLIVSRAGAMSIAELALIGKATVFVPSPNVSEDHQTHNARSLTDSGAALLLPDSEVRTALETAVIELMDDADRREKLGAAIRTFARPHAASDVVDQLERIARK